VIEVTEETTEEMIETDMKEETEAVIEEMTEEAIEEAKEEPKEEVIEIDLEETDLNLKTYAITAIRLDTGKHLTYLKYIYSFLAFLTFRANECREPLKPR
jgi:hypothetical protein